MPMDAASDIVQRGYGFFNAGLIPLTRDRLDMVGHYLPHRLAYDSLATILLCRVLILTSSL
jgi:hypothetical protein